MPTNGGKVFKGWTTNPNTENGKLEDFYDNGKQLTQNEYDTLSKKKNSDGNIVLYAIWEDEVEPPNNRTLWEQMQYLIAKNVYNYYWYASTKKYGAEPYNNSFINPKVYKDNSGKRMYYTEKIDLAAKENSNRLIEGSTHYYIDFFQTTDNRLGLTDNLQGERTYYGKPYRIHSLFNVNITYPTREKYKGYDDPLYCRIESEPYAKEPTPIRQIVININVDNTDDNLRPLFFFYDGPDPNATASGNLEPEKAQPVILNLNADFKGVLFMPDIPVVINGNGHKFEGFIIAKEYCYLDTSQGVQVKYSSTGKTDQDYSDNRIHVNPETGDVYSTKAEASTARAMYDTCATKPNMFNLSDESTFKTFKMQDEVKYMYIYYDYQNTPTLDPTPFYLDNGDLVPMYKFNAVGEQVRITDWKDVKLYDENHNLIPTTLSGDANKGTVRLDKYDNPKKVFDPAGNPIYFCEDYVNLTNTYSVFKLDRVEDGSRDRREFLLMKNDSLKDPNIANTDDWK